MGKLQATPKRLINSERIKQFGQLRCNMYPFIKLRDKNIVERHRKLLLIISPELLIIKPLKFSNRIFDKSFTGPDFFIIEG